MLKGITEKEQCTGCSACMMSCTQKAIEMKTDEKGFWYPVIDETKCIQCGMCQWVCASTTKKVKGKVQAFGGYTKDDKLLKNSSSGGVFALLAKRILSQEGVVYGAAMSEDCRAVVHRRVEKEEELHTLMGSKYLQSNMGDIYEQVRNDLTESRYVLFSGTPCQVDGLIAFLNREYERLICVEMACHGVPSPLAWEKYCDELQRDIKKVNFRHKKYGWELFNLHIEDKKGKKTYMVKDEDRYMRLFLANYTLRPCCFNCQHKDKIRRADIKLADFWGAKNSAGPLYNRRGTTLAIAYSKVGVNLIDELESSVIRTVDYDTAVKRNKAILNSVEKPKKYEDFWRDFKECSTIELVKKYCPISGKQRAMLELRKIKRSLER